MKGRHARPLHARHRVAKSLLWLAGLGVAAGIGTAAWGVFSALGAGTGSADVASLAPPSNVVSSFPNPSTRNVDVTWVAPNEPGGVVLDGYVVQRLEGSTAVPACDSSPTSLILNASCTDTDVPSGTFTYVVTVVARSWTASAFSDSVIVPVPRLTSFNVSPSTAEPTAGVPFGVVVTADDQYGDVDAGFGGTQCVAFSGPMQAPNATPPDYSAGSPCTNSTPVRFVKGVSSGTNITLVDAAPAVLSASEVGTSITGSTNVVTGPGPISALALDPSNAAPVAGHAFSVAMSAYDSYGNIDVNYTGDECVTFSGPANSPSGQAPTYPGTGRCPTGTTVNFTSGVTSGAGATVTLFGAGNATLSARDVASGVSGSTGLTTGPADLADFVLNSSTNTPVAGTAFSVGITANDQYGNVDTNYSGARCVLFAGSDKAPGGQPPNYPAASGCVSGSSVTFVNGVASGPGPGVTLVNATPTTLTATDVASGSTGALALTVGPAALTYLTLSPSDSTPVAGATLTVGITADDQYGNVDTNYNGGQCVLFTGSADAPGGQSPSYPAPGGCSTGSTVNFSNGVTSGVGAGVSLVNAGATNLTAKDVASGSSGTAGLVVGAGDVSNFALDPSNNSPDAGQGFTVSISADDGFGNVNTNYAGTHCLTFSGAASAPDGTQPLYPGSGSCSSTASSVNFDNGVAASGAVGVTLFRARATTLTITENSSGLSGATVLGVSPASATGLELTAITVDATPPLACSGIVGSKTCTSSDPGNTAGEAVGASIRLVDPYGNTTTNSGAAAPVDLALSGAGNVSPVGNGVLSIPSGQSTSTDDFVLSLDSGAGNSVTMVATLEGTGETLTITLSS